MAGKVKHAKRSMRNYKESQYAFGGFRHFDRKDSHVPVKNKKGLMMAVSKLLNSFKSKNQTKRQKMGDK